MGLDQSASSGIVSALYRNTQKSLKEIFRFYSRFNSDFPDRHYHDIRYKDGMVWEPRRDNKSTYNDGHGADGGSWYSSIRVPRKNNKQAWKQFHKLFPFLYEDDADGDPVCPVVEKLNGKRYFIRHANTAGYVNSLNGMTKRFELL